MIALTSSQFPTLMLAGMILALMCGLGGAVALWDWERKAEATTKRERTYPMLERQKDMAAALGWPWRRWLAVRIVCAAAGVYVGVTSHITLLLICGPVAGWLTSSFLLAGRAASRKLKMERAFLERLRDLRDRMSVSNQSLDTALQEIGRNPGKELEYVLTPLARGGSIVQNIVDCGRRSRSPVVEYACGVLIWARSRSLDALIEAIDEILLPVGEAQLAVQEEAMITLTQQRAVTMAMSGLMIFMFMVVVRVELFSAYYQTAMGNAVLAFVLLIFAGLVGILGVIVRIGNWTRWDLRKLAEQQERLGV